MNHEAKVKTTGTWADRFGALASGLCAAHCAICALAPALFAVVGLGALLSHEVELALTLVALGFGGATLMLSWREHRSAGVLSLLTVGMLGLMVSSGLEMAGEQHEHHGEHVAAAQVPGERNVVGEEHGEEHGEALHTLGAGAGVLGGLLLCSGHVANFRAVRRRREACCEPECEDS